MAGTTISSEFMLNVARARLDQAPFVSSAKNGANPFTHIIADSVLPSKEFGKAITQLPHPNTMRHLDKKKWPQRLMLPFAEVGWWSNFERELNACSFNTNMLCHLGGGLAERYEGRTKLECFIHRDSEGYSIEPHQDIPRKIATCLLYLTAKGDRASELGTILMSGPKQDYKAVTFKPNRFVSFLVSNRSWHRVPEVPKGHVRWTAQMFICEA